MIALVILKSGWDQIGHCIYGSSSDFHSHSFLNPLAFILKHRLPSLAVVSYFYPFCDPFSSHHLVFGLPLYLPSSHGFHCIILMFDLSSSLLATCPSKSHFIWVTLLLHHWIVVFPYLCVVFNFCIVLFVRVHVCASYVNTDCIN